MSARGVGHGLGKLVLCGEHAVVYGHPALVFAVDRRTTVELAREPGPTRVVSHADDARVREALCAAVEPEGWRVTVRSDVPVGRGMGSSAALAVALVRARADVDGEALDADEAFRRALPVERVFHGNPSGMDVAASVRGGLIRYRRGDPPDVEPLPAPTGWSVVALDSGEAGDTARLVAAVAARRPAVDAALDRIGALVGACAGCLRDARALGELLDENHALLRAIGVSTPRLDALVELARSAGAHGAKLAGAGGGGVVLALVDDPAPVLEAARRAGVTALPCAVGAA